MEAGTSLIHPSSKPSLTIDPNNNSSSNNNNNNNNNSSDHIALEFDGVLINSVGIVGDINVGDDDDDEEEEEGNTDDDDKHDEMFGQGSESGSEVACPQELRPTPTDRIHFPPVPGANDGERVPPGPQDEYTKGGPKAREDGDEDTALTPPNDSTAENRLSARGPSSPAEEKAGFPVLNDESVSDKLLTDEVSHQSRLMEAIQDIGVSNLGKLQHLDRSEPSVRRLLVRPRVTSRDVKAVTIDADIKAVVDDFLRTNVTTNFIIARVLRENYSTFYSWLATHIQCERNAWAARLKMSLDSAEDRRKEFGDTSALVIEVAARLRTLVQSCSTAMFGMPGKSQRVAGEKLEAGYPSFTPSRRQAPEANSLQGNTNGPGIQPGVRQKVFSSVFPTAGRDGKLDNAYQARKNTLHARLNSMSRLNERSVGGVTPRLTPSSLNVINVANPSKEGVGDSELLTAGDDTDRSQTNTTSNVLTPKEMGSTGSHTDRPSGKTTTNSILESGLNYKSYTAINNTNALNSSDTNGLVTNHDDDTDWKRVLSDSIEVLSDICDTLVTDRAECFRLVGVKPNTCASLSEAVSSYIKNRQDSGQAKRRNIEKRLGLLEVENKALLDEMTVMQSTLADKNSDALNLQKQLDQVEAMLQTAKADTSTKSVGTDDTLHPNHKQGGYKTRRSPYADGDLLRNAAIKLNKLVNSDDKTDIIVNGLKAERKHVDKDSKLGQDKSDVKTVPSTTPVAHVQNSESVAKFVPIREPSLIEISEEKLKTLKQRARKLEDSLHDAMSTMHKPNTVTAHNVPSSMANSTSVPVMASDPRWIRVQNPKDSAIKASLEVTSILAGKTVTSNEPIPRLAVIKRPGSKSERRCQSENPPSRFVLDTDRTSLLQGRSLAPLAAEDNGRLRQPIMHDMSQTTPIPSRLKVSADKGHGFTPVSRLSCVDFVSTEDERDTDANASNDNDVDSNDETTDTSPTMKFARDVAGQAKVPGKKKARVISRFRGGPGRGMVSKCLRCQKLFSSVDNHKLACCYHVKEKERLEHYDSTGRLIRVLHAWKCCRQPQECEGCCFGQHV